MHESIQAFPFLAHFPIQLAAPPPSLTSRVHKPIQVPADLGEIRHGTGEGPPPARRENSVRRRR